MAKGCKHIDSIKITQTDTHECKECVAMGDTWVHLRLCVHCGHIGCCDSSKNRHATRHSHAEGHPVIQSLEPGESWMWCNAHQRQVG